MHKNFHWFNIGKIWMFMNLHTLSTGYFVFYFDVSCSHHQYSGCENVFLHWSHQWSKYFVVGSNSGKWSVSMRCSSEWKTHFQFWWWYTSKSSASLRQIWKIPSFVCSMVRSVGRSVVYSQTDRSVFVCMCVLLSSKKYISLEIYIHTNKKDVMFIEW